MSSNLTDTKEIRKFGVIAFLFFGSLFVLGVLNNKSLPIYIFGSLSVLGLGFILIPSPLMPVYTAWLKIAHFMGRIITVLILTFAYYLIITPSAILKRLFGGRPLPVKPDNKVSSYWVGRIETAQPKERFFKRY